MLVEIKNSKADELELKVLEEDISILYIIQHELVKNENTQFAGVILPHQLMKDFLFRIVTKDRDPFEALQKAIKYSNTYSNKLKEILEIKLKENMVNNKNEVLS